MSIGSRFSIVVPWLFSLLFSLYAQEFQAISMPPPQKEIGKPLMRAFSLRSSTRTFVDKALPLQELSNLLWACGGINRADSGKRTFPSARNWQDMDLYVVLKEGVYLYGAKEHRLEPLVAGDLRALCGVQDFVKSAPLNLIYVSDTSRIKSNDDESTKGIWSGVEAGAMMQNVYLYGASQGLNVVVRGLVDKVKLAEVLKLRPNQKILLAQTIGYGK